MSANKMSKREKIAMAAMSSMIVGRPIADKSDLLKITSNSVRYADALLKELEKPTL